MRWRFFVSEAMHSVRGNAATTLAATVTVLIVTFLLGIFAVTFWWLRDYTNSVRGDVTVKAYMAMGTQDDKQRLLEIRNTLLQIPHVKSVTYVSPEDALKKLSKQQQEEARALGYNPLPPAFYIKLTDPGQATGVGGQAGKIPEVKNCGSNPCVDDGGHITKRVVFVTRLILLFVGALALLLGVASVVLIANTIRLSIFSRRREIEVMKLVGATNWFVRLPFVLEGMMTGLVGAMVAVMLLLVSYVGVKSFYQGITGPVDTVPGGAPGLVLMLALFGLLLGAGGSGMTLRKFLRV
ncbi:MAG: cell division protein FtsX [Gaiellales bacterium]